MRRIVLRMLLLLAIAAGALIGGVYGYFQFLKPERAPAPDLRIEVTPARIARGKYLFTLADCAGCHSPRDFSRFAGPVKPGSLGMGVEFPAELGLPGRVVAPNITPDRDTGLGRWSDGEKVRAIREGISRDGTPLFPMMPYTDYRHMSDEDVYSLVAYLNTLAPVRNPLPRTELRFPVSMMIRAVPRPAAPVPQPDRSNMIKYGEYLASIGGCVECHTEATRGKLNTDMLLAGGREFRFPGAVVVSANITPDPQTGIGAWSEQHFLERFYSYRKYAEAGPPPVGMESFTLMPWLNYAQVEADDLRAIYAYLRVIAPHSLRQPDRNA